MIWMGKIVDEYKLGRINNTVSFFFFFFWLSKREPGLNSVDMWSKCWTNSYSVDYWNQ